MDKLTIAEEAYKNGYEKGQGDAAQDYIELREQYDKIFLEFHDLRDAFIDYVCSGTPNPSPFCLNKCPGCCDSYGWCKYNDECKGFNPAEVILDGAKMDGD